MESSVFHSALGVDPGSHRNPPSCVSTGQLPKPGDAPDTLVLAGRLNRQAGINPSPNACAVCAAAEITGHGCREPPGF